jgi:hypothetical protein
MKDRTKLTVSFITRVRRTAETTIDFEVRSERSHEAGTLKLK